MKRLFLFVFLFVAFHQGWSQKSLTKKQFRFSVSGGIGWNHYINSLKIGTNSAVEDHLGYSVKIMWEPEHRLAIGIESGYFPFYVVERTSTSSNLVVGSASLSIVPILLHFRCRVLKNLYVSAGTGASVLLSSIKGIGGSIDSNQLSLSNFQVSTSYLKSIHPRIRVGGELKYLSVDKTEDESLSLMAVAYFRF